MGLFSSIVRGIKNLFGGDDDDKKKKQSSNQREITRNFQTRTYNSISQAANAARKAGEQAATRSRLNGNNTNQNKYQEFYNNQKKKYEEREEQKKSSNLKREENKYQNKYADKAQDNKKAEDIIKYTFATAQDKKNVTANQKKLKETQERKEKQAEENRKLYQSDEWKKNQGKQIEENKKIDELAKYTFMTNGEKEAVKNHETHPVVNAVVRWKNEQSSNLNRTGNVLLDRWDKGPISAKSQTLGLSIYEKDREEQMKENEERIKKADERIKKTTEEIEEFKEGQSAVGKFLTDVAVAGTELGLDLTAGKFTRTGMLPMFSRAAGMSAASAEEEGADRLSAWKYGVASGGIEALTEKMFVAVKPLNKVFGKGFTDELAQKAVNRLASKMTTEGSQKAVYHGGRMLAAAFGEGLEEMVSEGLDPSVANAIYADAIGQHKTLNPRDVLYSGLIGGTMGGLLGTGNVISENYSFNQNRESNQDNLDDIIKFAKDTDENSLAYKNAEAMRKVREAGEDVSNMQIEITKQELARDMEAQEKEYDNVINAANEVVRMNSFTSPVVEDNGYIVGLADNTERTYNDTFMAASEAAGKTFDNDLDIEDVSNAVASIRTGTGTVKDTDFFMPQNTENRKVYEEVTGEKLPSGNVATRQYLIEKIGQNFIQSAQAETEYRNDMVKGEILQNEMQNLDAAGQDIFVRGLESVVDGHDAEYASLFNHYYKGGRAGGLTFETVANMNPAYNNSFPESLKRDAFNAGQFDSGYLTNRTAENSSGKGSGGRVISTGRKVKASDYKFYQRVAQATGIDIEVTDNEGMRERLGQMSLDDNGTPNGFYDIANNRIIVNYEGDRAIDYIVSHELTHYMQDNAPEEYKALKEFLRKAWKEADIDGYNASIARKIQDYEKQGVKLSEEEALDEILADSTYEMIQNEDILRAICQENRTLAQKILDALKKILDMFRGMRTDFSPKYNKDLLSNLEVLEDTIAMWENGIKVAAENRNIKSFEITESDIYKNINAVIDMEPVSVLNDTEFSAIFENDGIKELKKRVSVYYEEIGGYVHNKDIGDVLLSKRGVKDDVGHGIGKTKSDAFKTVPDVIEKGKIIQAKRNWKGRKYDSVVIAAPVEINSSEYLEGVVIKRDVKSKNQGLYVHEVLLQKNSSKKVQPGGLASKTSPSQFATINNLLQNIIDVKNGDLSREELYKNIDTDEGRFSLKDSDGNTLTKAQAEYFQKSKVRDDRGNLMVMYHGTPTGGFTVFNDGTYFTANEEYADRFQDPSSSSISAGKEKTSPETYKVYLNIEKPFDIRNDDEARRIYINEYIKGGNALGINPYETDDFYRNITGIDWTEGEDLREFLIDNEYDYDGLVLNEGADGGYGEDVQYRDDAYVIFNPEQVKSVDNENPTSNEDIRYSMRELDERYMAAVESGDMKTAQAMVNAYAKARGYDAEEEYRGLHEAPRAPIARENFQNLEELQKLADDGDDLSLYAIANGISIVPDDFFTYEGARLYGNDVHIINEHGEEQTEKLRGQRAITENDFLKIRKIIEEPDDVRLADEEYNGRPVIHFIKEIHGRTTIVSYDSKKHYDLRVQTMYSGQEKRSLATGIPEQAGINTPEAPSGTASTDNISEDVQKGKFSLKETEEVENNIEDIYNSDDTTQFHNMPSYGKKALRAKAVRQKSYEELQNEIQHLREEFKVTDGKIPDKEDIRRKVRMLVSDTLGQNMKKGKKTNLALTETITDYVYNAAIGIRNDVYEPIGDLMEAARELAYEIDFTPNHVLFDYYMGLNEYLRQTPIRLTERDKANITDYNYLRKRMFGKVKLVNADHYTDGNIENVYMEMHELFPELISGEAEVTDDMLNEIIEVRENFNNLDDVITDEEFEQVVKDLAGDLLDITFGAKTRVTRADRWQQKYDKLKSDMQKALADANAKFRQQKKEIENKERAWYREKRAEAVRKEREKAEKKLEKYKEKQKQSKENQKERKERRDTFNRIEKTVNWLGERTRKPTDNKHLPEGFRQPMAEFLSSLDLQTIRSEERQKKEGKSQKKVQMDKLRIAYEQIAKEDGSGDITYDSYVFDLIKAAEIKVGGKPIDYMTTEQLKELDTILTSIKTGIHMQSSTY